MELQEFHFLKTEVPVLRPTHCTNYKLHQPSTRTLTHLEQRLAELRVGHQDGPGRRVVGGAQGLHLGQDLEQLHGSHARDHGADLVLAGPRVRRVAQQRVGVLRGGVGGLAPDGLRTRLGSRRTTVSIGAPPILTLQRPVEIQVQLSHFTHPTARRTHPNAPNPIPPHPNPPHSPPTHPHLTPPHLNPRAHTPPTHPCARGWPRDQ